MVQQQHAQEQRLAERKARPLWRQDQRKQRETSAKQRQRQQAARQDGRLLAMRTAQEHTKQHALARHLKAVAVAVAVAAVAVADVAVLLEIGMQAAQWRWAPQAESAVALQAAGRAQQLVCASIQVLQVAQLPLAQLHPRQQVHARACAATRHRLSAIL